MALGLGVVELTMRKVSNNSLTLRTTTNPSLVRSLSANAVGAYSPLCQGGAWGQCY